MAGLVALDMYDWPELRAETTAFWHLLRAQLAQEGIEADTDITRASDVSVPWRDPGLLLAQTCGLPLVSGICADAVAFARPSYDVEGCARLDGGGTYRSALIARKDAPDALDAYRGGIAAVNDWGSQSGYNAFAHALSDLPGAKSGFFDRVTVSGSHRASADAVAAGAADLCALDAVAWAIYQHVEPTRAEALKVLGWTAPAPTPPFITAPKNRELASAICRALDRAARAAPACPALPVSVDPTEPQDYRPIRDMAACVERIAFVSQI